MASEPDHIRAFISIHLDPSVLRPLQHFQKKLDRILPADTIRWASPDQLHLTLKFLGNVPTEALPDLQQSLAQIASQSIAMGLRAEGLGAFPSLRNPRVIWVGLEGDLNQLEQLTARIEEAMQPWAEKEEKRGFHPHLTLGRIRENAGRHARAIGEALEKIAPPHFGTWRAERFHLMRSQLSPYGATHTVVAEFPLAGAIKSSVAGSGQS
jgi:2'-5' RNA ligase